MKTIRALLAILFFAALLLAPALAEARAGGGSSTGSRGGQTFQSTPAKPIERSITQPPSQQAGVPAPGPLAGGALGGGMMGRSPFMNGLLGGFLGAGLFGMLFGHSSWAAEGAGAAGMLGLFLQFALIAGLAWLALALFRRRMAPAGAGATGDAAQLGYGGGVLPQVQQTPEPRAAEVADRDREAFGVLLTGIQRAWSEGDLKQLARLATPEMVSYFAEDLADAASRGVRNVVKDAALLKGDVVDSWIEGDRHYATAVMTWRAIDYVERDGAVIGGDAKEPVEATEAWTFMRVQGGNWLLSAIQQV